MQRGWFGPNKCCLCKTNVESVDHLFVGFPFVHEVIHNLSYLFDVNLIWFDISMAGNLSSWVKKNGRLLYLPFFFIWNLWKTRNCLIFENVVPNIPRLYHVIMSEVDSYLVPLVNRPKGRIIGDPLGKIYPMVFFIELQHIFWVELVPVFG